MLVKTYTSFPAFINHPTIANTKIPDAKGITFNVIKLSADGKSIIVDAPQAGQSILRANGYS